MSEKKKRVKKGSDSVDGISSQGFASILSKIKPVIGKGYIIPEMAHVVFCDGMIAAYNDFSFIYTKCPFEMSNVSVDGADFIKAISRFSGNIQVSEDKGKLVINEGAEKFSFLTAPESVLHKQLKTIMSEISSAKEEGLPSDFITSLYLSALTSSSVLNETYGFVCVNKQYCYSTDGLRITRADFKKPIKVSTDILLPSVYSVLVMNHKFTSYFLLDSWIVFKEEDSDIWFGLKLGNLEFPIDTVGNLITPFLEIKEMHFELPKEIVPKIESSMLVLSEFYDIDKMVLLSFKKNGIVVSSSSSVGEYTGSKEFPSGVIPEVYVGKSVLVNPLFLLHAMRNYSMNFFYSEEKKKVGFSGSGILSVMSIYTDSTKK